MKDYPWNKKTIFNQRIITETLLRALQKFASNTDGKSLHKHPVFACVEFGGHLLYLLELVNLEHGIFLFLGVDRRNPKECQFINVRVEKLSGEVLPIPAYNDKGEYLGLTPSGAYRNPQFKKVLCEDIPEVKAFLDTLPEDFKLDTV